MKITRTLILAWQKKQTKCFKLRWHILAFYRIVSCLKGPTVCFGIALTWTVVFSLWKKFTPTWNQLVHVEICSYFCSILLDVQSLTEKLVFECPFAFHIYIYLFLSHLVDNFIYCIRYVQISFEIVSNAHVCQLTQCPRPRCHDSEIWAQAFYTTYPVPCTKKYFLLENSPKKICALLSLKLCLLLTW